SVIKGVVLVDSDIGKLLGTLLNGSRAIYGSFGPLPVDLCCLGGALKAFQLAPLGRCGFVTLVFFEDSVIKGVVLVDSDIGKLLGTLLNGSRAIYGSFGPLPVDLWALRGPKGGDSSTGGSSRRGKVNLNIKKDNTKVVDTCDIEEIGRKEVFCRCWRSKSFPYCDGSHT
ncbi:CDGSH iron-sulfur domain-containing protein 1, partial [Orchesella cincta]